MDLFRLTIFINLCNAKPEEDCVSVCQLLISFGLDEVRNVLSDWKLIHFRYELIQLFEMEGADYVDKYSAEVLKGEDRIETKK